MPLVSTDGVRFADRRPGSFTDMEVEVRALMEVGPTPCRPSRTRACLPTR